MTVWSIVWVLTRFEPRCYDQRLASFLSGGLVLEVGLITLQQWRGVPSHFNRATTSDAAIESMMLGLILLVTAGIAWLCWRSRRLLPMAESQAIAIRAGLMADVGFVRFGDNCHNCRRDQPRARPLARGLENGGGAQVSARRCTARDSDSSVLSLFCASFERRTPRG